MNGQWLGSRSIRTNWATRKPPATKAERKLKLFSIFNTNKTHLYKFIIYVLKNIII